MGLEQMGLFGEIKQESDILEKKRQRIYEQLDELKLKYIDQILKGQIKVPKQFQQKNFKELLSLPRLNATDRLREIYSKKTGLDPYRNDGSAADYERWSSIVVDEIDKLHTANPDNWIQKLPTLLYEQSLVLSKKEEINNQENSETEDLENQNLEPEGGFIGPLNYHAGEHSKDFKKYGISEYDDLISIHLLPVAMNKGYHVKEGEEKITALDALTMLAEKIVKQYPKTKAIVGYSWLLGTPSGERLGFHIIENEATKVVNENQYEEVNNVDEMGIVGGGGFWYQFIDKNGNLNKERAEEFLKTGVPKYKFQVGYIPIEEFLRKYLRLPKGELVHLKRFDQNEEYIIQKKNNSEVLEKTASKVFGQWDSLSIDQIMEIFNQTDLLLYFKTEDGMKFEEKIRKAKKDGLNASEAMAIITKEDGEAMRKFFHGIIPEKNYVDYSFRL